MPTSECVVVVISSQFRIAIVVKQLEFRPDAISHASGAILRWIINDLENNESDTRNLPLVKVLVLHGDLPRVRRFVGL